MNKRFLAGVLLLLLVLSGAVTTAAQSTCVVTAVADVTAYMKADFGEVFATLEAGTTVEVQTWTLSGWYGFDPGFAQAPNQGLDRLRWLPVDLQPGMRLDGDCDSVPPVDGGVVPPTAAVEPRITRFVITPTGTLNDYALAWAVDGTDTAVLGVHLPGDPSGEPMLVLDELPLRGDRVVTVPFHTPDSGVRFVLWGVNRVENPPSPQQRYEYVVSQTLIEPPFATPTVTASPVQPPATVSATLPPFTPSPTYTLPPAGDLFNVPSTYQRFDNGLMIWRSDTGFIWAVANDGRVLGFKLVDYGNLPQPNAAAIQMPAGKLLPIFGFGQVWANYPVVRDILDWGVSAESGFILGLGFNFERDTQLLRLPDQRWIELLPDNTWRDVDNSGPTPLPNTPPPVVTPVIVNTGATFQQFDNGFTVWRADFGDIHVFEGQTGGMTRVFSMAQYSHLPDPVASPPPTGGIIPIFGFGKVWGNFADVRQMLGWAVVPEEGFTLNIQSRPEGTVGIYDVIFTLLDGRRIIVDGNTWRFDL